jgi:hypothetical protein
MVLHPTLSKVNSGLILLRYQDSKQQHEVIFEIFLKKQFFAAANF